MQEAVILPAEAQITNDAFNNIQNTDMESHKYWVTHPIEQTKEMEFGHNKKNCNHYINKP